MLSPFLCPVPGNVPPIHLPDLSKPPPGFPGAMNVGLPPPSMGQPMFPPDLDLIPTIPYFDLPAGLMAPLVKVRIFAPSGADDDDDDTFNECQHYYYDSSSLLYMTFFL